jgi:hypothetical protein
MKLLATITRMIHENISIVMCFAYSQRPLEKMVTATFKGEWKHLNKALFTISEERAERACLELAFFLRILDDEEDISGYHKATQRIPDCGCLIMNDASQRTMPFREVANKIIHASRLEWSLLEESSPILICHPRDNEKWTRAEVDVVALAAVCGQVMS